MAGKKNTERTKLRAKHFRFRTTASGITTRVMRMVVATV
jgi:hypothetical protein